MPKSSAYFHLISTVFLIALLLSGCGGNETTSLISTTNSFPYQIDLQAGYNQEEEVNLSEFAESIKYIPLATQEGALLGRNAHVYLTDEHIISTAFRQILVFDRVSGAFISEPRKYGEGPSEYRNTFPYTHINEKIGAVYIKDNRNNYRGLNFEGKTVTKFQDTSADGILIMGFAELENDLIAGYIVNYDCKRTEKLVIFNREGELVKSFANHLTCVNDDPQRIYFDSSEGAFYRNVNEVMFKETYNDSLFVVTADSLIIKAVFQAGERALPYEEKIRASNNQSIGDYFIVGEIDESSKYIFFSFSYRERQFSSYYNKETGETRVSRLKGQEDNYFVNDIDNFLPFHPSYVNNDGELVGYIEAPDVLTWFDENPDKAAELPDNLKVLSNMKEDDNPVVMIVKLKD